MWLRIVFFTALLLAPVLPLAAHHSLAAEFDSSRPVVLRGKVTRVDWMNPHVYLWIDAVDAHGGVTNWRVESAAPNYLQHLGWSKASVKPGDELTIRGYAAKDESKLAKMDTVTLPDGRRLIVGHAGDATP